MSSTFGSSSSSLFSRSSSSSLGGLSAHFEPALKKVKYDGDHAQNSKATRWRFWKWIPPMGARPVCGTDDYGQLMASFKEHLTASSTFLYQINELRWVVYLEPSFLKSKFLFTLRHFAKLELSPILGYVNLDSSSEEEKENVSVGSSSPTLATSVRGYYIFKDGIWPLWEDEYNAAGGCWTFRHSVLRGNDGEEPSVMWKKLVSFRSLIVYILMTKLLILLDPHPLWPEDDALPWVRRNLRSRPNSSWNRPWLDVQVFHLEWQLG